MKKVYLIKPIRIGTIVIEDSKTEPFVEIEPKKFIRGTICLPSCIDITDKDYFIECIESKFHENDYVIYNSQPCVVNKVKKVGKNIIYNIHNLYTNRKIDVSEPCLKRSTKYFFINSDGEIVENFYGTHPKKDTWLISYGNCYKTRKEAEVNKDFMMNPSRLDNFIKENNLI